MALRKGYKNRNANRPEFFKDKLTPTERAQKVRELKNSRKFKIGK